MSSKVVALGVMLIAGTALADPPKEIADMAKATGGTWKCTGTSAGDKKLVATVKTTADLDGWWVHDSIDATEGDGKTATKAKLERYTTFDAGSKKYRRVVVMSTGVQLAGTSDGMKDLKMDYNLVDTDKRMFREHVDASDLKRGLHLSGEVSADKDKWTKSYDMVCRH